MGLFDKAKDAFEAQKDKIDPGKISEGIERAGDFIDSKTGGKYADKVDKAQDFASDKAHDLLGRDDEPGAPAAAEPDAPSAATPPVTPPVTPPATPPVTPPAPKPGPPPTRP